MKSKLGQTAAIALWGTQGTPISIEASVNNGLPGIDLVGLPDTSVSESKKRVRAAVANVGITLSAQRITVNLSPGNVKKCGTAFDLAIAMAILIAEGQVSQEKLAHCVLTGELGLDGRLHPVVGVLPTVLAARQAGFLRVMVPQGNAQEAQLIEGIRVDAVDDLSQAIRQCGGESTSLGLPPVQRQQRAREHPVAREDLADVRGQDDAKRALEVAAAGGHHMMMIGSPGAGKTMLAGCLPGLLPPLTESEAVETLSLQSIDGTYDPDRGLDRNPPFEAPHHRTTAAAMVGGSRPGAVGVFSKAHRGVLFMDEAPEFNRDVLEALRQPLENGLCNVGRAWGTVSLPARFQLILAANPCPCGVSAQSASACTCTPVERRRYRTKLSGPILDRIDIQLTMLPATAADMYGAPAGESSADVAVRVRRARERQRRRYRGQPWSLNAHVPGAWLRSNLGLARKDTVLLDQALENGTLTVRGYDRVLRVAATVADLDDSKSPTPDHINEALMLRSLES